MVSGSHNPPDYNGFKFADRFGRRSTAETSSELGRIVAWQVVPQSGLRIARRTGR